MKKRIVCITLLIGLIAITGCGIPQSDYQYLRDYSDNLSALLEDANSQIIELNEDNLKLSENILNSEEAAKQLQAQIKALENEPQLTHFENRNAIEDWLGAIPQIGISEDVEQWYLYGLYYQQKAMERGYICSVAYYYMGENSYVIWCEVLTVDGYIYYFDPDDCILIDTGLRIDIRNLDDMGIIKGNYL